MHVGTDKKTSLCLSLIKSYNEHFPNLSIDMANYYKILDVCKKASLAEIQHAYSIQLRRYHPNKAQINGLTKKEAEKRFNIIEVAYETLSDPDKRYAYDQYLSHKRIPQDDFLESQQVSELKQALTPEERKPEHLLKNLLFLACKLGKLNVVKYMIEVKKLSPRLTINIGNNHHGQYVEIFIVAASHGHLSVVQYLYENHPIDLDTLWFSYTYRDFTPMGTALSKAAEGGHIEIVIYLLEKGANPKIKMGVFEPPTDSVMTCVILSEKEQMVKRMIDIGLRLPPTSLRDAFRTGDLKIVQYIVQAVDDINYFIFPDSSLGIEAVSSGNINIMHYLDTIPSFNIFKQDDYWPGFLVHHYQNTLIKDIYLMIFLAAVHTGSLEMVSYVFERKGLKNAFDGLKEGVTQEVCHALILSYALFQWPQPGQVKSLIPDRIDLLRYLMDYKKITFRLDLHLLKHFLQDDLKLTAEEMAWIMRYVQDIKETELFGFIAEHGLKAMDMMDLMYAYRIGFKYHLNRVSNYCQEISIEILERLPKVAELKAHAKANESVKYNALFYFISLGQDQYLPYIKMLFKCGIDMNALMIRDETLARLAQSHQNEAPEMIAYLISTHLLKPKSKSSKTGIESLPSALIRHISDFIGDDFKSLSSINSASSCTHRLFSPDISHRKLQMLLSAIFMGKEAVVVKLLSSNPQMMFERGTYKMPLLNSDGSLSRDSEQIYHDVTPLELSLYTGDWKMWEIFMPMIPKDMLQQTMDVMHQMKLGGPDLVKIDRDPRALSWEEIEYFHHGVDVDGNPIIYDLLKNPDGILCFTQASSPPLYFYVNKEAKIIELLSAKTDGIAVAFKSFQDDIDEMVMNSSRRLSNAEHALIERIFGKKLARFGIHYTLHGVRYQDTMDGSIRLVNAYRKFISFYHHRTPETSQDAVDKAYLEVLGKAQRNSMPHEIQLFLVPDKLRFNTLSRKVDRLKESPHPRCTDFYHWAKYQQQQFYPLKINTGCGIDFVLHRGKTMVFDREPLRGITEDLAGIHRMIEARKTSFNYCLQTLQEKLHASSHRPAWVNIHWHTG